MLCLDASPCFFVAWLRLDAAYVQLQTAYLTAAFVMCDSSIEISKRFWYACVITAEITFSPARWRLRTT